ncbi:MAG: hypoxanthine phosphoribosyltransferase [Syntrophobacterales bacterium]|nr:hypoxanthine phosphoribosyltransferase [Syntrophobacterales bacterium]
MKPHTLKCIFNGQVLKSRIQSLAQEINRDYSGKDELIVIGILKGAFIFMADLVRFISIPMKIDFMRISSYGSQSETSGNIQITKDVELPIESKDVLVIEDIVDTGLSLDWVVRYLMRRNPKSLKVCVLIDKAERRECDVRIDYYGFKVEKGFLVGYGLDYSECYRNLEGIYEVCFSDD